MDNTVVHGKTDFLSLLNFKCSVVPTSGESLQRVVSEAVEAGVLVGLGGFEAWNRIATGSYKTRHFQGKKHLKV